ncbi:MAG: hypothetical protein D6814_01915 [Calditrichaeota bacterium]|nr:MAG: hypothetical protein D6814_01915 [Calditrichota bacterium]
MRIIASGCGFTIKNFLSMLLSPRRWELLPACLLSFSLHFKLQFNIFLASFSQINQDFMQFPAERSHALILIFNLEDE